MELPTHVRITNVSFGEDLADLTARTVVKLTYSFPNPPGDDEDDEDEDATPRITTVLCALTPGKVNSIVLLSKMLHTCILFHSVRLSSLLWILYSTQNHNRLSRPQERSQFT